ncbi:hypothetical protein WVIC16_60074 [Weissella viridescens]|nr:hypothetical protein WVIC16_60074 [Weissella viridescens]
MYFSGIYAPFYLITLVMKTGLVTVILTFSLAAYALLPTLCGLLG